MDTARLPGFVAEASVYPSSANYQALSMVSSLMLGGRGTIRPAMRSYCHTWKSMKGPGGCCTVEFGDISSTYCCDPQLGCYYS
jgi:hypothetical protein